ncbi:uncharacterized protein N7483_006966 [Penicillium malachiteum]|uniref:uncharacterized protein n=1 Tax=Penicillium malachiteum TaxID=1324776 RepID=UPI002549B9A3|nr:uncharacterized protein N7483_006966 [Penicillium malachiteum]KAJ5725609.1 hypothetical protein N7483_006966 [Penicillium malachiteum]
MTYGTVDCPPWIENCSASEKTTRVTTETIPIHTTVYPIVPVTDVITVTVTEQVYPALSTVYITSLSTVLDCPSSS